MIYVIAAVGFVAVLPFTLYWIVRAWLAGGTALPLDGLREAQEIAARWGGTIMVGFTDDACRFCSGWWATASKRDELYPIVLSSETRRPRGKHHDATPGAAIAVLVAALRAALRDEGETT